MVDLTAKAAWLRKSPARVGSLVVGMFVLVFITSLSLRPTPPHRFVRFGRLDAGFITGRRTSHNLFGEALPGSETVPEGGSPRRMSS